MFRLLLAASLLWTGAAFADPVSVPPPPAPAPIEPLPQVHAPDPNSPISLTLSELNAIVQAQVAAAAAQEAWGKIQRQVRVPQVPPCHDGCPSEINPSLR